ncbi:GTPase activating protein [Histoplasma capsulatum G186AR]|uniref:GTPase activating protein n=1 Tax=Ajellomyces capsulatus (strain G186AR / H82 / ATCC MYA-2454 / RMSCC 2432) TaxID=447093 RepID=C0NQ48_AJECG|nr:GTPase activating protein [Histoplasma capsulatum G186AR]EEH07058.1 GTPase activating protein [Histoplasma capsulatum G186AR]
MADGPPPPDGGPAPDTPLRPESELPPLSPSPPEKTALPEPVPAAVNPEEMAQLEKVLQSDDFSTFLRKRSALEEEHAQGLKKLARAFHDSTQRIDNRQGTFSTGCEEINRIHDRMADHGLQFALSLQQMSEDLNDLVANMERGRKHWKQNGLNAEKRVQDAESMAEKAKAKYNSLAEQYDRARTGDAQPGKFGLKGHKSAAQHEQDLLRKVQHSDSEYASKVQTAQGLKNELMSTLRPQAVRALQDLVAEGDSGLSLQMQKFATFTEKLMLGNGLCVSPLKNGVNPDAAGFKSLREVAAQVDDEKDFKSFILSHASKIGSGSAGVKYEKHPVRADLTLATPPPQPTPIQTLNQPGISSIPNVPPQLPGPNFSSSPPQSATAPAQHQNSSQPFQSPTTQLPYPAPYQQPPRQDPYGMHQQAPPQMQPQMPSQMPYPTPGPQMQPQYRPYSPVQQQPPPERFPVARNGHGADLPPLKPVFGVSLEELFQRDGTAIPMIVYQCIQGVELFGLNVEGIYRLSGNANHIAHLKSLFDNDSSQVDFTNPENFFHDVNSVAGLLKQFFRELPDPLFTNKHYADFINAARRDDDIQRRDALHALINNLPDPNYATLRALILHLNHVHERSAENRMNAGNIAISFGLTLMGSNAGQSIADSGWQARVIETILQNTFQIFDED